MAKAAKSQKRILVVEDDFLLIKILQAKLLQAGFDVHVATDGVLAMAALHNGFNPDLIVLDLVMPRKDGFEVLHELRAQKSWQRIPVMVLSNLGQASDIERVKHLGVSHYLVKSDIAIDDVIAMVKTASLG